MPLKILSTLIREDGKGTATVELTVSDNDLIDHAVEQITLRVLVKVDHPYFPGLQEDAIKRAIEILESTMNSLPKNYK